MIEAMTKILSLLLATLLLSSCSSAKSWREASRESIGIAPKPSELTESIVQVYAARAFSWRGNFAIHPWISFKRASAKDYTVTQVVGWRLRSGLPAVLTETDLPDRRWFDSAPEILFEARGARADRIITRLEELIPEYPFANHYRLWPGPNSNTYIAYLIRNTPELDIELPAHAIGKDWLETWNPLAPTASGTGFQFSLLGALGFSVGVAEGVEVNILGLNFGVDFWAPALKLPFVGRVGMKDRGFSKDDEKAPSVSKN